MKTLTACSPEYAAMLGTDDLREQFMIDDLFVDGEAKLVYSHNDRVVLGGFVPTDAALDLPVVEEMRSEFFLERREAGVINVGETATVTVDGTAYEVPKKGCLYIGRGARDVSFAAPGRFYLFSAPAHTEYPTTLVRPEDGTVRELGDQSTSNRRSLVQYIHPDGVKSCQVMMGVTSLHEGSMWNTMPAHTHERRMEAYLYFDVPEDARVVHLMGEPSETRHLIMGNEQAVVSPPWSIHCGVGTAAYSFIWAMAGENQAFDDMDAVPVTSIR